MTDKNTVGKLTYITCNIFLVSLAMICYRYLLFIPISPFSELESVLLLWALVITMLVFGVLITFPKRRNFVSILTNVLAPFQLYGVISFWEYFGVWVRTVLLITALLCLLFTAVVILQRISANHPHKAKVLKRRLRHALLGARTLAAVCLCALLIPLSANALLGNDLFAAEDGAPAVASEYEDWTIANNIETVMKIKPSVWKELDLSERIEVLSTIKNIEMRYLGICHEVSLSADKLSENVLGCYNDEKHKITIDVAHLKDDSVDRVVRTLLHECHHVYSYQQVAMYDTLPDEYKNMLLFYEAQVYAEEYENYVSDDYAAYAAQRCEIDADLYADKSLEDYYKAIFEYETKSE